MHRIIMGVKDSKILIDHKDHNGLNNQKFNLRICAPSQNQGNGTVRKNSVSKYLGVCRKVNKRKLVSGELRIHLKWSASMTYNKKKVHMGTFPFTEDGEILAAKAYDLKAKELHGEFANLNFKS